MTKDSRSYADMLKDELLAIAQRLGLTNLSRLRKDEIIDLITRARAKEEASRKERERKQPKKEPQPAAKAPVTKASSSKRPSAATKPVITNPPPAKPAPAKPAPTKPATKTPAAPAKAVPPRPTPRETPSRKPDERLPVDRSAPPRGVTAQAPARSGAPSGAHPSPLGPVSPQAGAMASKYQTSAPYQPDELLGVDEALPELPETYGDNRIVLLPRDLSWLFTYWDLTQEYKEAARAAGGRVLALRLYDVTGVDFDGTNARGMHEHECAEWARSWYLPTPTPDRDYIVEIGYRGADQWFPLARSNKVSVPSDQPSTWIKDDFISIRFEEDLRDVRDRLPPDLRTAAVSSAPSLAPQTIFDDGELRIVVGGTLLPPSGVPGWPLSSAELMGSQVFVPGSVTSIAGSVAFLPSSGALAGSVSFIPGSVSAVPGSVSFLPSSAALAPSSPAFFPHGMLPSSPGFARPPRLGGALRDVASAEGSVAGHAAEGDTSAPAASGPPPEPPLLLASVEMVISGRSMPGTELRIAGRSIPLGPDGAFSLRITVPEGLRELPIEARSPITSGTRRMVLRLGRESE